MDDRFDKKIILTEFVNFHTFKWYKANSILKSLNE